LLQKKADLSSPVSFASNSGHGYLRKGTTGKEI